MTTQDSRLRCAPLLLALLLGACAGSGPPAAPPPPTVQEPPPPSTAPTSTSASAASTYSATLALLNRAEQSASSGELDEAAALVERAIRIEPRRGDLWLRLGELTFQQSHYEQAEQFARKGLLFLQSGSSQERSAWLLIADAREALGDDFGAQAIRDQWQRYRG